jgi:putative membrane protein insertion efficiency factor
MGLAASSRVESSVGFFGRLGNVPFVFLIRLYRLVLSPVIGGQCRFEPTCSVYGLESYRLYGPIAGTRMTIGRICRCHPWIVRDTGAQDERSMQLDTQQEGDGDGETPSGTET